MPPFSSPARTRPGGTPDAARSAVRSLRFAFTIGITAVALGAACSSTHSSPVEPTPPPAAVADVAGTWSGLAADSSGPGEMTWRLTQSAATLSGTFAMRDADTGLNGQGTITGTLSGSTLTFAIAVAAGGFDAPFGTCSSSATGTADVSATAIAGTYTGSNSCTGTITSGQLTLSRQ